MNEKEKNELEVVHDNMGRIVGYSQAYMMEVIKGLKLIVEKNEDKGLTMGLKWYIRMLEKSQATVELWWKRRNEPNIDWKQLEKEAKYESKTPN